MNLDDTKAKLQALKKRFKSHLPNKLIEIEHLWEELKNNWNTDKGMLLFRSAHNLKGATGTYGYIALSHMFSVLEKSVEPFIHQPPPINAAEKIDCAIREIRASLESPTLFVEREVFTQRFAYKKDNKLIFLLDKDAAFLKQIREELQAFGYDVCIFSNLNDLELAFEGKTPFVLLIDIEFLDEFTSLPGNKERQEKHDFLMIVVSKESSFDSRLCAVRAGGECYITKPFPIEELIDEFESYVSEKYNILIIEDTVEVAEYYSLMLADANMQAKIITDPSCIDRALVEFDPDLILMDIYMPECNGLELAAMIRQQDQHASVPIIFLSSEDDREKQLKALSIGVDDFISKATKPEFAIIAIKNCVERYRLLRTLIVKDSLTKVFNHSTILKRLQETMKEASRTQAQVAVAMIDLDNFKSVNDTHGHAQGDKVLKNLCLLLRKRLRESDIIGRYGGEEFLVVLPNTNAKTAKKIIDEVREKFSKLQYCDDGTNFSVTFSAGVADFPCYNDVDLLVDAADALLYMAKERGRNIVLDS